MAGKCDICGKVVRYGCNVSHSKRHTPRAWMPNIHVTSLVVDGKTKRFNLCTRCIRTRSKAAG
ncbi:MAG: 50S ribosomal protein L28 [Chloroflexi bacterium]|nr:50S ribosomal protein L28 [Chloroflexota bacterium]